MVLVQNPLTKVCTSYNQTIKCMRVHLAGQNLAVQQSHTDTHTLKCACASARTQHMGTYSNTNKSGKVHK